MPSLDHTFDAHCTVILFAIAHIPLGRRMTVDLPPRPTEMRNVKSPPRRPPADGSNEFASFCAQLAARSEKRLAGGASAAPPPSVDREEDREEATSHSLSSLLASHRAGIGAGVLLLVTVSVAALLVWGLPFQASTPLPSNRIEQAKADVPAAGKREVTVLASVPAPPAAEPLVGAPPASPRTVASPPPAPPRAAASAPPVSPPATSPLPAAPPLTAKELVKSTPEFAQSASQIPSTAEPSSAPLTPDEIRELQGKLKAAGFNPGAIDGFVGRQTRSAMRDYAQARSLPNADATRDLLVRLNAEPPAVASAPASPPPAPPPPVAQQVDKPTPDGAAALTPDDIRYLQDRLQAAGYYMGAVDGVMGRQTRSAVREYAEAQGIPNEEATRDLLSR
jgi:peptidoglycan hydrolase-like protein with peptidoglycan-binding domain